MTIDRLKPPPEEAFELQPETSEFILLTINHQTDDLLGLETSRIYEAFRNSIESAGTGNNEISLIEAQ